jgi:EAL domain-containing protein (putative c-di-GMP-specific phosphodiesterase class I)
MVTTAEGIETAEHLKNVRALGYTEAQGYLISRPMSQQAVHQMLNLGADPIPEPEASLEQQPRTATRAGGQ